MSNLNSTNKLTEFPPLEPDDKSDGKFSFSKFMFWRKGEGEASGPIGATASSVIVPSVTEIENQESIGEAGAKNIEPRPLTPSYYRSDSNLSNPSPDSMSMDSNPFTFEARTLPNVLRRISNLIAMGTNNPVDIKKYWMPDSVSKECYECAERFTTFRRKHHCRICGQIFCSRCCNQEIPGKIIGYSGELRVCVYCCKIVLSYLRSADATSDLTDDLRMVQEDLMNRFGNVSADLSQVGGPQSMGSVSDNSGVYRSLSRRKTSVSYQEERFAATREHFDSFTSIQEDKPKIVWDWVSLKSMWEEMLSPVTGIDWAIHRHNMMKYCHSCVVGSELVDWLLAQRKISWRGQGVQIGQLLIDAHLLECVSQAEQVFVDAYALYKPVQVPLPSLPETSNPCTPRSSSDFGDGRDGGQDPLWVKQIQNPEKIDEESEEAHENDTSGEVFMDSTQDGQTTDKYRLPSSASLYSLDLNLTENKVSISKPKETEPSSYSGKLVQENPPVSPGRLESRARPYKVSETMTDEFLQKTLLSQKQKGNEMVTPMGWHSPQQLTSDSEVRAFQKLCNSYVEHENNLLNQLLESMNLSGDWADIILPIVHKVTEIVRPDVRHTDDEMDIRQYIRFKKLPGGTKTQCRIVNGVVCTKNIAHRSMRNKLKDPRILLIGSSIDNQRFENRFLSLEPLVMQEPDYLRNTVSRIVAMKPDLVIVEKTVSRLAQEYMLDRGVTLVLNVKPSVMERIGRLTQGAIWKSADTQLGKTQLGLCHNFYLETFKIPNGLRKTLMYFDGCAMHLGCTILLRGGSSSELVKVKKITSLLMFVAYNWRLERSFHIDSFAMPPLVASEEAPVAVSESQPKRPSETTHELIEESSDLDANLCSPKSDISHCENPSTEKNIQVSEEYSKTLEKCLNEVILSASPFIKYPLPYLETNDGTSCKLRVFFPDVIYWSDRTVSGTDICSINANIIDCENSYVQPVYNSVFINSKLVNEKPEIAWRPSHSFTTAKLTSELGSEEVQEMLADFRRNGTRLEFVPNYNCFSMNQKNRSNTSSWNTLDNDRTKPDTVEGQLDALDPFKHQRLAVMFCSYSPISTNAPYFCVNPCVVNMDMYGRNDTSLGMFLERYCFRRTYACPASSCDTPMLDHIRKFVHNDGCVEVILRELQSPILGSGESILMWNWCAACRTVSPIVPMSVDAWSLSFAKYLELRFYGQDYSRRGFDNPCPHSLHRDHQQYFAQHSVVAAFNYTKIELWEVSLPDFQITVKKQLKSVAQLIEDVKSVAILGYGVYTNIFDVLTSLKENSAGLRVEEILTALTEQHKAEQRVFRSKIEDIQVNLASPTLRHGDKTMEMEEKEAFVWTVTDSISALKCSISDTINSWNLSLNNFIQQKKKEEKQAKDVSSKPSLPRMDSEPVLLTVKDLDDSIRSNNGSTNAANYSSNSPSSARCSLAESGELSSSGKHGSSKDISDSQMRGNSKDLSNRSVSPYKNDRKLEHERTKSDGGTDKILRSDNQSEEVVDSGKVEKRSSSSAVKTIISNFLSAAGNVQVIQYPWMASEHYFPASLCIIPIPVFESEPSSIVAYALSSTEYRNKLKEKQKNCSNKLQSSQDDSRSLSNSVVYDSSNDTPKSTSFTTDGDEEKEKLQKADGHIEIQFGISTSSAKFYCRVYFADNFRLLRKQSLMDGEEFFIRSLARCVSWTVSGGKSGSSFCKTNDDRFVIKQMSRFEIQSFLDFAPNYFEYMKTAFKDQKPTVLAKILGVYRIGFKNPQTNAASKMDILIMENLFYECQISKKFDLKGSIRNRLANVTGKDQEDLVLLDENLVNTACENPMYIRPHTKTVLSLALSNDSKFLASQMVMDYSLLVGLDENKRELIVGIIDYIRTFTWDKKIETFVKSSGILGGQGKTPTVVSPTEYQSRFCEAMDRYFILVPDRWLGLGLGIDSL